MENKEFKVVKDWNFMMPEDVKKFRNQVMELYSNKQIETLTKKLLDRLIETTPQPVFDKVFNYLTKLSEGTYVMDSDEDVDKLHDPLLQLTLLR